MELVKYIIKINKNTVIEKWYKSKKKHLKKKTRMKNGKNIGKISTKTAKRDWIQVWKGSQ